MLGRLGQTATIKSVHLVPVGNSVQELYKLNNKPAKFFYKLRDTATHDFPEVVKVIVKKTVLAPVRLTQLTLKKAMAASNRRKTMTKSKSKSKSKSRN